MHFLAVDKRVSVTMVTRKNIFYYLALLALDLTFVRGHSTYNGVATSSRPNEVHVCDCATKQLCDQLEDLAKRNQIKPIKSSQTDKFEHLAVKWRALLVPVEVGDMKTDFQKYVSKLSSNAQFLYQNYDKNAYRNYLWPIRAGDTSSAPLTTQFWKLRILTLAYGTYGTNYYKDPEILSVVKDGLDFLTMPEHNRYDGEKYHENWWDWQVAIPENFIDILMIIKDELPLLKIQRYTKIMNAYVQHTRRLYGTDHEIIDLAMASYYYYELKGTQKTELARALLGLGILQKNEMQISFSLDSIEELTKLVTKGNGFYLDGSFIYHQNIPYTGQCGDRLLRHVGTILAVTQDSEFEMDPESVQPFVDSLEHVFLPLFYRGEMIAPVKDRSNSRAPPNSKTEYGSAIMYNLLSVSNLATFKSAKKIKAAVKYWMSQNRDYYTSNARNYNDLQLTIDLLNDATITFDKLPFVGTKMYASMDRFVQRTSGYMLGLSLYSNRISAFEAGNNENQRGWHTADGAIYLYNDDGIQFSDNYWPTVDPYRIPGTTVDTRPLENDHSDFGNYPSKEKWVGGVAYNKQAVVGMALNKAGFKNMDLKGKKSWFIVDGKIVALGAGITGKTTSSIETIVENRLLNNSYYYKVVSNRGEINAQKQIIDVHWLLLKTSDLQSSIGYYFPCSQTVDVVTDIRSGTYTDINAIYPSNKIYTGEYRKFIINHGKSPVEANYAYVILPGINQSKLTEYTNSRPVNILANSADIQAVELAHEGYLGMNIWNEGGATLEEISSDKPVSLMRQTEGNEHTYVLSDPTQSNNIITIKVPYFYRVGKMSDGVNYDVNGKAFLVDFTNAGGASKQFTVYTASNLY